MPLMPPECMISDLHMTSKLLDLSLMDTAAGSGLAVIFIENFDARIHQDGVDGVMSGRARHYFQDGFGLVQADWAAEITLDGETVRVESDLTLTDYSNGED